MVMMMRLLTLINRNLSIVSADSRLLSLSSSSSLSSSWKKPQNCRLCIIFADDSLQMVVGWGVSSKLIDNALSYSIESAEHICIWWSGLLLLLLLTRSELFDRGIAQLLLMLRWEGLFRWSLKLLIPSPPSSSSMRLSLSRLVWSLLPPPLRWNNRLFNASILLSLIGDALKDWYAVEEEVSWRGWVIASIDLSR